MLAAYQIDVLAHQCVDAVHLNGLNKRISQTLPNFGHRTTDFLVDPQ